MDIFKWADDNNWMTDYMDMNTGYVYHIQNASEDHNEIFVTDSEGHLIGKVTRNN
jgi:hypothetical protein